MRWLLAADRCEELGDADGARLWRRRGEWFARLRLAAQWMAGEDEDVRPGLLESRTVELPVSDGCFRVAIFSCPATLLVEVRRVHRESVNYSGATPSGGSLTVLAASETVSDVFVGSVKSNLWMIECKEATASATSLTHYLNRKSVELIDRLGAYLDQEGGS